MVKTSVAEALLLCLLAGCSKENNVTVGGGEPEIEVPATPPLDGLIDNLEYRRDAQLPNWDEREGYWFSYIDMHPETDLQPQTEVAGFDPTTLYYVGGANETETAVLFAGKTGKADDPDLEGLEIYGGGIGIHVNKGDPYDAASHGYTGISFWMKKIPTSNLSEVSVKLPQAKTWTDCTVCLDHLQVATPVTNSWTQYTVSFAEGTQLSFGDPVDTLDASQLIGVVWGVPPGKTVELLIDEVAFVSE